MIKKIFALSAAVALMSCGNDNTEKKADVAVKDTVKAEPMTQPENEFADFQFHTLVANIPSPLDIITELPKAGMPYNESLINSDANAGKYTTSTKKALNYGSYIVDLVYLSTNEHFSQVKNYFKVSRSLAQSLDCAESFDKIAGSRMEKNIDQKDTINKVIDQIFGEMDGYLRSNDRLLTATQILTGSWIESQYITTSLIKDVEQNDQNTVLFKKVKEQKFTSEKLVEMFKEYEKEKDFKPVMDGVKELNSIYGEMQGDKIDKALLAKLNAKLTEVRGKIVN
jgi:hypothetical protein